MKTKIVLILVSFLVITNSFAKVLYDDQVWINTNAFIKLKEKVSAYIEIQPRYIEGRDYLGVTLYRSALGYDLNEKTSFWLGYGYIEWSHPVHFNEHRPFLQFIHHQDFNRLKLTHRGRFEIRNLQDRQSSPMRVRYLLRGVYDLKTPWNLHAVIYNEWFNHLSGAIEKGSYRAGKVHPGFDQNRLFVGIGKKFTEKVNLFAELGYMNQFIDTQVKTLKSNHIIASQLTFKF